MFVPQQVPAAPAAQQPQHRVPWGQLSPAQQRELMTLANMKRCRENNTMLKAIMAHLQLPFPRKNNGQTPNYQ